MLGCVYIQNQKFFCQKGGARQVVFSKIRDSLVDCPPSLRSVGPASHPLDARRRLALLAAFAPRLVC